MTDRKVVPIPRLLTVDDTAQVLSVSRWRVYQLIWGGELRSVKIGRSQRIPTESIDAYITGLLDQDAA